VINLGSTNFVIYVPVLPRDELEAYSTTLFDEWETRVASELGLSDYALILEVEEGSLKGRTKILASIGVVAVAVANYDGFFSGLERIEGQVRSVSEFIAERAVAPFHDQRRSPLIRSRRGVLGHLQVLFVKVQRRELTPEQAMREAEALLGVEADESPEFLRRLEESLEAVPLHPEQLVLPMDLPTETEAAIEEDFERRRTAPRPKPIAPPPERFRVEIRRESKRGKKSVTVTIL